MDNQLEFDEVTQVKHSQVSNLEVFNIGVATKNSYTAEGIVVHNCITETSYAMNNGFLASLLDEAEPGEATYSVYAGRYNPQEKADEPCNKWLGMTVKVLPKPPRGGTDTIDDPYARYAIWPGKSSVGMRKRDQWIAIPSHPNCTHFWEQSFPQEGETVTTVGEKGTSQERTVILEEKSEEPVSLTLVKSGKKIEVKRKAWAVYWADHRAIQLFEKEADAWHFYRSCLAGGESKGDTQKPNLIEIPRRAKEGQKGRGAEKRTGSYYTVNKGPVDFRKSNVDVSNLLVELSKSTFGVIEKSPSEIVDLVKSSYDVYTRYLGGQNLEDVKTDLSLRLGELRKARMHRDTKYRAEDFKVGAVLLQVPEDVKRQVRWLQMLLEDRKVPLAEEGMEKNPHVTVLYGVKNHDLYQVRSLVNTLQGKVEATVGGIGYFDNDDATVMYLKVNSKELVQLHQVMKHAVPNLHRQEEYTPHITVAYLKPGSRLEGATPQPLLWKTDMLYLSDGKGNYSELLTEGGDHAVCFNCHQKYYWKPDGMDLDIIGQVGAHCPWCGHVNRIPREEELVKSREGLVPKRVQVRTHRRTFQAIRWVSPAGVIDQKEMRADITRVMAWKQESVFAGPLDAKKLLEKYPVLKVSMEGAPVPSFGAEGIGEHIPPDLNSRLYEDYDLAFDVWRAASPDRNGVPSPRELLEKIPDMKVLLEAASKEDYVSENMIRDRLMHLSFDREQVQKNPEQAQAAFAGHDKKWTTPNPLSGAPKPTVEVPIEDYDYRVHLWRLANKARKSEEVKEYGKYKHLGSYDFTAGRRLKETEVTDVEEAFDNVSDVIPKMDMLAKKAGLRIAVKDLGFEYYQGRYLKTPGTTERETSRVIELDAERYTTTLTHEMGHFLDDYLGSGGSKMTSVRLVENYEVASAWSNLMKAVNKTEAWNRWRSMPGQASEGEAFGDYLTIPEEIFARLFEQYVASKRKGKPSKAHREYEFLAAHGTHLTDKEFQEIEPKIKAMLDAAGGKGFSKSLVVLLDSILKAKQVWVPPTGARKGYYRMDPRTKKAAAPKAKIVGTKWISYVDDRDKRVSNWEEAEECSTCGRKLVHVIEIEEAGGIRRPVGKECAWKVLGWQRPNKQRLDTTILEMESKQRQQMLAQKSYRDRFNTAAVDDPLLAVRQYINRNYSSIWQTAPDPKSAAVWTTDDKKFYAIPVTASPENIPEEWRKVDFDWTTAIAAAAETYGKEHGLGAVKSVLSRVLNFLKAAVGLVQKRVSVKGPRGVHQAVRWVKPEAEKEALRARWERIVTKPSRTGRVRKLSTNSFLTTSGEKLLLPRGMEHSNAAWRWMGNLAPDMVRIRHEFKQLKAEGYGSQVAVTIPKNEGITKEQLEAIMKELSRKEWLYTGLVEGNVSSGGEMFHLRSREGKQAATAWLLQYMKSGEDVQELFKARAGLVKQKVQVRTRHGVRQAYRWVRPGGGEPSWVRARRKKSQFGKGSDFERDIRESAYLTTRTKNDQPLVEAFRQRPYPRLGDELIDHPEALVENPNKMASSESLAYLGNSIDYCWALWEQTHSGDPKIMQAVLVNPDRFAKVFPTMATWAEKNRDNPPGPEKIMEAMIASVRKTGNKTLPTGEVVNVEDVTAFLRGMAENDKRFFGLYTYSVFDKSYKQKVLNEKQLSKRFPLLGAFKWDRKLRVDEAQRLNHAFEELGRTAPGLLRTMQGKVSFKPRQLGYRMFGGLYDLHGNIILDIKYKEVLCHEMAHALSHIAIVKKPVGFIKELGGGYNAFFSSTVPGRAVWEKLEKIGFVNRQRANTTSSFGADYYARPEEIFARIFEQRVSSKSGSRYYAASTQNIKTLNRWPIYLNEQEAEVILPQFADAVRQVYGEDILKSFLQRVSDIVKARAGLVLQKGTIGLVKKKVQVRTKRGVKQAYRWTRPEEAKAPERVYSKVPEEEIQYSGKLSPEKLLKEEPGLRALMEVSNYGPMDYFTSGRLVHDRDLRASKKQLHPFLVQRLQNDYDLALRVWKAADPSRAEVVEPKKFLKEYPDAGRAILTFAKRSVMSRSRVSSPEGALHHWRRNKINKVFKETYGDPEMKKYKALTESFYSGSLRLIDTREFGEECLCLLGAAVTKKTADSIKGYKNLRAFTFAGKPLGPRQAHVVSDAVSEVTGTVPNTLKLAKQYSLGIKVTSIPPTKALGVYIPQEGYIELDLRHSNALAHEFCHFFDHRLGIQQTKAWTLAVQKARTLDCGFRWASIGYLKRMVDPTSQKFQSACVAIAKEAVAKDKDIPTSWDLHYQFANSTDAAFDKDMRGYLDAGVLNKEQVDAVRATRGMPVSTSFYMKMDRKAREFSSYLSQPNEMLSRLFEQYVASKGQKNQGGESYYSYEEYTGRNAWYTDTECKVLFPFLKAAFAEAGGEGFLKSLEEALVPRGESGG